MRRCACSRPAPRSSSSAMQWPPPSRRDRTATASTRRRVSGVTCRRLASGSIAPPDDRGTPHPCARPPRSPPCLKNPIDWVSRAKEPAANPFRECVFALGSTSDGWRGGHRALMALRQSLEFGLGTLVVPGGIFLPGAASAFDQAGDLKEERWAKQLRRTLDRLVALCQAER